MLFEYILTTRRDTFGLVWITPVVIEHSEAEETAQLGDFQSIAQELNVVAADPTGGADYQVAFSINGRRVLGYRKPGDWLFRTYCNARDVINILQAIRFLGGETLVVSVGPSMV
jgi:hypothetical protein